MTSLCIKIEIYKYTKNTNTQIYKVLDRPNMCHIFEKHGFKDIKYEIPVYQMRNTRIRNYANTQIQSASETQNVEYFSKHVSVSKI